MPGSRSHGIRCPVLLVNRRRLGQDGVMPEPDPVTLLEDPRFRWLRPALLIAAPLALLLPVLLSGDLPYGSDMINIFYYSRLLIVESLKEGRLPVWDSTSMAGFPLLAGA